MTYEAGGIAKDGAKMVTAVATRARAEADGDRRRLLRGGQLRHVRPRLLAALPVDVAERARVGDGRRAGCDRARDGRSGQDPGEVEALRSEIRAQYETQGHPYYASARLWDDGVIDPLATRDVVGLALSACANAPLRDVQRPVFRM